jgi:peroxiredoxin-like protein
MPTQTHHFHVDASWTGLPDGDGVIRGAGYQTSFGRPAQIGGTEGRSNPEEMLIGAVVSCYAITFAILAERRRLPLVSMDVAADGEVEQQLGGTLKFVSIRLQPRITLSAVDDAQIRAAEEFAHRAEQYCVISNALRGNVAISVEPTVEARA